MLDVCHVCGIHVHHIRAFRMIIHLIYYPSRTFKNATSEYLRELRKYGVHVDTFSDYDDSIFKLEHTFPTIWCI